MSLFFSNTAENNNYIKKLIYQIRIKFPRVEEETIRNLFREMKANGVLMAGGSILHVLTNQEGFLNDFDLYSPLESVKKMVEVFETEFVGTRLPDRFASTYSMSFLRKNGIHKVISFSNDFHIAPKVYQTYDDISKFRSPTVDLMELKQGILPLNVVSNFDLTFCQVWFDGEKFYATHSADVRSKKGKLNQDYLATFLAGNTFLKNRFKKYVEKGFSICVPSKKETNQRFLKTPLEKNNVYFAKWFYKGAFRYALGVYPLYTEKISTRIDPVTNHEVWRLNMNMLRAMRAPRVTAQNIQVYQQAKRVFEEAIRRIANITKPLDGIDDGDIESFAQLVAMLGGDTAKAYRGVADFSAKIEENNEEWDARYLYQPYVQASRRIVQEVEKYRRTQLRSFTGSQFARSLPQAGIQQRILEMSNEPSLREQAITLGVQMPAVLRTNQIQAALNQPPLASRPQMGLLQAPNWGNRPRPPPLNQAPAANAGSGGAKKKTRSRSKAKAQKKTRKH